MNNGFARPVGPRRLFCITELDSFSLPDGHAHGPGVTAVSRGDLSVTRQKDGYQGEPHNHKPATGGEAGPEQVVTNR